MVCYNKATTEGEPVVILHHEIGKGYGGSLMAGEIEMKRYLVRYEGRVQGVGFRYNAVRQNAGLALHGFVRNQPDGSVLMDVEGSLRDLKRLLERIKMEMKENIEAVEVTECPLAGHGGGFKIQH